MEVEGLVHAWLVGEIALRTFVSVRLQALTSDSL